MLEAPELEEGFDQVVRVGDSQQELEQLVQRLCALLPDGAAAGAAVSPVGADLGLAGAAGAGAAIVRGALAEAPEPELRRPWGDCAVVPAVGAAKPPRPPAGSAWKGFAVARRRDAVDVLLRGVAAGRVEKVAAGSNGSAAAAGGCQVDGARWRAWVESVVGLGKDMEGGAAAGRVASRV